jgi:hypothetical protein
VIPENIFSVAHTIKGTGSFLGRPWREAPVHFAEIAQLDCIFSDASPHTAAFQGGAVGSIVAQVLERPSPPGKAAHDVDRAVRQMPGLSASHVQTAAVVGTATSLAAQSAAADGSP